MVREDLKTKATVKSKLFGFMLINIIPIGGLIAVIWGLNQGKISMDDLPGGLGKNALYFGLAILLLIITASLLLPLSHACANHFRATLAWSKDLRRDGGFMRKLWEVICWLPRQLAYRLAGLFRLILIVASIALILAAIVFMVRCIKPEFLEEELSITPKMERVERYVREFEFGF